MSIFFVSYQYKNLTKSDEKYKALPMSNRGQSISVEIAV